MLRQNSMIIALIATSAQIYERVKQEQHRPLLDVKFTQIEKLLQERTHYYSTADLMLDTSAKLPVELLGEIISELTRRGYGDGRNKIEFS